MWFTLNNLARIYHTELLAPKNINYRNFVNAIKSPATRVGYENSLKRYMNFSKQTKSGSDCQCIKSTAYSNRGANRTNTVRPHLLDRNHISVRTTPAGLSLGIRLHFFNILFLLWHLLHALYVNQRIYSENKARSCCFFWRYYLCICKSVWSYYNSIYLIYI